MNKNLILKIINPVLLILLISQAATGLSRSGIPHETFEFLHEGGGIALVTLSALHLILNFGWVKINYFKKHK
jgi:hypothetical protein